MIPNEEEEAFGALYLPSGVAQIITSVRRASQGKFPALGNFPPLLGVIIFEATIDWAEVSCPLLNNNNNDDSEGPILRAFPPFSQGFPLLG